MRLALVALAAAAALLAAGVRPAAAAPSATLTPTNNCWLQVVNDWLDHNGEIHGTYAIPCYTQAIQQLSKYPDLQQYSNAIDDIHRALLAAIQQERADGPGSGPPSSGSGGNTGGQGIPGGGGPKPPANSGGGGTRSPVSTIFHPSNAQSIPLPLIILAALAALLLLAGAGTWFARRLQAKRMTPATAPGPPRPR
ncbi:MAG TPA: hypothetical protein VII51_06285 [Gaiellaceae bacterium]